MNTFLFSGFIVALIWYNNTYTRYRIPGFTSPWSYAFFMVVISMQLAEYFVWTNINNPFYNCLSTAMVFLILFFQPVTTIMLMHDSSIRYRILKMYLSLFIPVVAFSFYNMKFHSSVSKKGHLLWNFYGNDDSSWFITFIYRLWFLFFLMPLYFSDTKYFYFGVATLLLSLYNYYTDRSQGSLWCWLVNIISLYYAAYLLLYLPLYK